MSQGVVEHSIFPPSPALRRFVKRFEVTKSQAERTHILLPDTSLVACFRLDGMAFLNGSTALPAALVSGLQDRARRVTHMRGSQVLLAVFTEAGAATFLREPMHRLFNQTMPLECVVERSLWSSMHAQMMEASEHCRRVEVLERFFLRQLEAEAPDPVAEAAARLILRLRGSIRMEKLAKGMGFSLSALERRFRMRVGASPRSFAKIVRMRHALRLRKAGKTSAEVAHMAGYCDQSHFIKAFRGFTGCAPESFFREDSSYC